MISQSENKATRMFPFITETRNPVGGHCPFECSYCWSQGPKGLVYKFDMQKYQGPPRFYKKELGKVKPDSFVFVSDMRDLFSPDVPDWYIIEILNWMRLNKDSSFLLLTKNPKRYLEFLDDYPKNVFLGATIESDLDYAYSNAPKQSQRLAVMTNLRSKTSLPLFISIEPVLDFSNEFVRKLNWLVPFAVAVGYDNYNNGLEEPPLSSTLELIRQLESFTKVYRKTLREAVSF